MAIPKKVVTDKMDTSEEEGAGDNIDSKDTSEQQECGYVNLGSKGPGKPIQIRTTGTQNVNEQSASASSIVRNPAVPPLDALVLGTSTEKFADNISVERDTDYPSKHIPAVDPLRVQTCLTTSILQPGYNDPSTSDQNQTQMSPAFTRSTTTPRKRKIGQDEEEQHFPKKKVPKYEDMKDVPGIIAVRGYLYKVRLDMIPMLRNLPPASATQTYSQMLLQQQQQQQQLDGHVDRPPDMNEPLNLCTRPLSPLNLSSRPLDLSLNKQAPDQQMVIGEPSLVSCKRNQPPTKCTVVAECQGLGSVIGPQYTEGPENTVGQVDDVSFEEKDEDQPDDVSLEEKNDDQSDDVSLEEKDENQSDAVNVPGNLPDLGVLTLDNKKSKLEKKKDAEKNSEMEKPERTLEQMIIDQSQGNEMQTSAASTGRGQQASKADLGAPETNLRAGEADQGTSGLSFVPNFDSLEFITHETNRDKLMSKLRGKLKGKSLSNNIINNK